MQWKPSVLQTHSENVGYNGPYQTMLHLVFLLAPQIAFSRCCQATTAHIKRFLVHKLNLVGNTMRLEIFTTCTGGITSKITLLIISKERINALIFIKKKKKTVTLLERSVIKMIAIALIRCMCLHQGTKWETPEELFKLYK